jgi:ketosteroid isomerase-like protein
MRKYFIVVLLLASITAISQKSDADQIRTLLNKQIVEWNKGNIEGFMKGYWESDSLLFVGKSGPRYGYKNTLENYKKGYPDTAHMGKLSFDILNIKKISADHAFVLGRWKLKRSVGDAEGVYTLIMRKIKGRWVIIADHSS